MKKKSIITAEIRYCLYTVIGFILTITVFTGATTVFCSFDEWAQQNCNGFYSIMDNFDSEDANIYDFFKEDDSLEKLTQMYELLCDRFNCEYNDSYCVMDIQRISADNKALPHKYCEDLSVSMNNAAIRHSNMDLYKGNVFTEHYVYNTGDVVDVIVGYNMKYCLDVGDVFDLEYLGKTMKARVCGILKKGADCPRMSEECLDGYIIIPAFEFENNNNLSDFERRWRQMVLTGQTNGFVTANTGVLEAQRTLDKICREVDIKPYCFTGLFYNLNFFNIGYANSTYLVFFGLLLLSFAFGAGLCVIQRGLFSVLLNCNQNASSVTGKQKVFVIMYTETFVCAFLSWIICVCINNVFLLPVHIPSWFTAVTAAVLWAAVPLLCAIKHFIKKKK